MESEFWNERYAGEGLAYGEAPNEFLAQVADRLPTSGSALDIGAGEGRNAVFLAGRGLDVLAVDLSRVGLQKAQELARARGLSLRTQVVDLAEYDVKAGSFALVTSIWVHLPPAIRVPLHERVSKWLRPGGVFVLEAYGPEQCGRGTGGPQDPSRYATLDELLRELGGLEIEHQAALVRDVTEGRFHSGDAPVVQVLARKR